MSDLFGNHIVGFPTRRLILCAFYQISEDKEEKKPASTAEKSQEMAKKDDSATKEKGMYEESDSDEEKVGFATHSPSEPCILRIQHALVYSPFSTDLLVNLAF